MDEIHSLEKLCQFKQKEKWMLIYRGSRDGFSSRMFHSKCDGFTTTLTLIQTTRNNIFGGFTTRDWAQKKEIYKRDPNAFLFSLKNENEKPIRIHCSEPNYAVCSKSEFGPIFGGGNDICILNESNLHSKNFSRLGCSYKHPLYEYESYEGHKFLAGTKYFQTKEIEVYYRIQ